jgi:U3 small nucleolar ribonucleoprotein protein IMP3
MCQHFEEATNFVRQGHIRVGPDVITDPSYFVTRGMEDFVTWVDQSKIKRKIASYNNTVDDYDLMN